MILLTPEFLTDLAHYNAGVRRAVEANRADLTTTGRIPQPCGTNAAYRRHLAHNENPCGPCSLAASDAQKEAYAKRVAKKAATVTGEWVSDDDGAWLYESDRRLGGAS